MSIMATPWRHTPQSGVFTFVDKFPLKTKELSIARPRFAKELAKCEKLFATAREQLAGRPRVMASDTPKLADRWACQVVDNWERCPSANTLAKPQSRQPLQFGRALPCGVAIHP